jgi:DNA-binding NarL/FixJ family response regulator
MKLLLLDDHEIIRESVIRYIKDINSAIEIIEAQSIEEAEQFIATVIFDYAICDLELTKGCDLSTIEGLHRDRVPFMIHSSHVNKVLIKELESKKVRCYVSKASGTVELKKGIEALLNGRQYYCPMVQNTIDSNKKPQETGRLTLSKSEKKVIAILAEGHSREEAAAILKKELTTINNHVYRARESNDCRDLGELIRRYNFWSHD